MSRITNSDIDKLLKIINSNLPPEEHLELRSAYGYTGVAGMGGAKDLSGLGTKSETWIFLRGFQEGMSMAHKVAEMDREKAQSMGSL